MADFTVGTMSDLIAFEGSVGFFMICNRLITFCVLFRYLNTSAPFDINEYNAIWKNPNYMPWNFTQYRDFDVRPFFEVLSLLMMYRPTTHATNPVNFPLFGKTAARPYLSTRVVV